MTTAPATMPVRARRVEMSGDYAGFWAEMRVNISMRTLEALSNTDDLYPEIAEIVREWNFVDEGGQPIPVSEAGLRSLPIDLFAMLQSRYGETLKSPLAVTTSPDSSKPSPRAASRRRRSTQK